MDFSTHIYEDLLQTFISNGYLFLSFYDFQISVDKTKQQRCILLRHDVDKLPLNSLRTAEIEHSLGVRGSYYFRIIPKSYDIDIIKKIADLGHEVGYHYEDVDLILKSCKNDIKNKHNQIDEEKLIDLAYKSFCNNLERIRKVAEVNTICMHGSPLSKYDNKIIWKKYNYRDLKIVGEPYFDIDWNILGYLTDTGRCWNAGNASIRDKVNSKYIFNFKTTYDIINNFDKLPDKLMVTIHPQRWNSSLFPGLKEYFLQNTKNIIKKYFLLR